MAIEKEIKYYIEQKETNGALLITGSWGCGKSYLIKEIAKEYKQNKKAYIGIISLFGVLDCNQLNEKVKKIYFDETASVFKKIGSKAIQCLGKVVQVGSDVASNFAPESLVLSGINKGSTIIPSIDVLNYVTPKSTIKCEKQEVPFILIFDDFERCDIPIKNLLGVINDYCENKKIKTIIIADEEKINCELESAKDDNKSKEKEGQDITYKDIKEKVVSNTISLIPDYEAIIDNIVKEYKTDNKDYISFLTNNISLIKEGFPK